MHNFRKGAKALKLGFIGLNIPGFEAEFTPCVEIGWRLTSKYWGQGLATEGAKAMIKLEFEKFSLTEIIQKAIFLLYLNIKALITIQYFISYEKSCIICKVIRIFTY